MATYAFPNLDARKELQHLYEAGVTHEKMAMHFGVSRFTIITELKRGYEDTCLPNGRRTYSAEKAQAHIEDSLLRRGGLRGIRLDDVQEKHIKQLEERIKALEEERLNGKQEAYSADKKDRSGSH